MFECYVSEFGLFLVDLVVGTEWNSLNGEISIVLYLLPGRGDDEYYVIEFGLFLVDLVSTFNGIV